MKNAEIHLSYFKQGTDLSGHLEHAGNVPAGLESHAESLEAAAKQLRAIQTVVTGQPVEIYADTHYIAINGPDAVIDRLLAEGLAEPHECDDEEDFEEDELLSAAEPE